MSRWGHDVGSIYALNNHYGDFIVINCIMECSIVGKTGRYG